MKYLWLRNTLILLLLLGLALNALVWSGTDLLLMDGLMTWIPLDTPLVSARDASPANSVQIKSASEAVLPPTPIASLPRVSGAAPFILPEMEVPALSLLLTPTSQASPLITRAPEASEDRARAERHAPLPTPTALPTPTPRPTERKPDYAWLTPYRAQAFPSPSTIQPGRLVVPAINLDSIVKEVRWSTAERDGQPVSLWNVADYAVGFHFNSALPGAVGNTVMAGHNNIRGQIFRNLNDLKIGDEAFVFAGAQAYRYVVAEKYLVKEAGATLEQRVQNAGFIATTNDMRLTLISCWPYTSNTHRVIIVAKPATKP